MYAGSGLGGAKGLADDVLKGLKRTKWDAGVGLMDCTAVMGDTEGGEEESGAESGEVPSRASQFQFAGMYCCGTMYLLSVQSVKESQ